MSNSTAKKSKSSETLSKKLTELEELSQYFESGEFDIDDGLKKYEQGMKLAQEIKKQLTAYELKITEIKEKYSEAE